MKFLSPVYSQTSGSIAGLTYAHNQGGLYVRARRAPTNPNSEPQQAVRAAVAFLADAWTNTLTAQQREDWETYAFNTPTTNALGLSTKKSGQNMFVRGNTARIQAGLDPVLPAPVVFDVGGFTQPGALIADASAQTISVAYFGDDEWIQEDDSAFLIYQSRPQNPSRNFFKGPYQLATRVDGNSTLGPVPPKVFTSLFPLTEGQRVFLKFNVTREDGRFSYPIRLDTIVQA